MFDFLRRVLHGSKLSDLKIEYWDYHAGFSHPRWPKVVEGAAAWRALVQSWLSQLRLECGNGFGVDRSDHFVLLSPWKSHQAISQLDFLETTYRTLVDQLRGIQSDRPLVVLILRDAEQYRRYLSHFVSDPEGYLMGMCIRRGYPHLVVRDGATGPLQAELAYEFPRLLLADLGLPVWLEEGVCRLSSARVPAISDCELKEQVGRYGLKDFWSGLAFDRSAEQRPFAGQLAEALTRSLLGRGPQRFSAFLAQAGAADSGQMASERNFGESLGQLLVPLLGEGDWAPPPSPVSALTVLLEETRWSEAVEFANQALKLPHCDHDLVRLGRARALIHTPEWRLALDDFAALPERFRNAEVVVQEFWTFLSVPDYPAAERLLVQLGRRDLTEAQRQKSAFLYAQGLYSEAMKAYETCKTTAATKYVGLGWCACKMGQPEKAGEYAQLSLAASRNLSALLLLAQLALDAGSQDEAESFLKECLELAPDDITTWHLLGCLAEARGQQEQAREAFLRCVEEGPKRRSWEPEQERVRDAQRRLSSDALPE